MATTDVRARRRPSSIQAAGKVKPHFMGDGTGEGDPCGRDTLVRGRTIITIDELQQWLC